MKYNFNEMLKNLILIGYNISEISKFTKINRLTLSKLLKKNYEPSITVQTKILQFFNKNIDEVEIGTLSTKQSQDKCLIYTPDGWRSGCGFIQKGLLQCYNIKTQTHQCIAAAQHMFQLEDNSWIYSELLKIGDKLICENGIEEVKQITKLGNIQCFDISIDDPNHRYYLNGISSHNTGKSLLAATIMANAQKDGCTHIFYFDAEGGALKEFFENAGCNPDGIQQILVENVQDAQLKILDTYNMIIQYKEKDPEAKFLCVLDSLGALVSEKVLRDAAKDKVTSEMGGRAKICLAEDTLVLLGNNEYKQIKDIIPGDKVITHLNKIKQVKDNIKSHHTKYLKFKVNGEIIKMSLDHKMLISRNGDLMYCKAKDIQKADKFISLK